MFSLHSLKQCLLFSLLLSVFSVPVLAQDVDIVTPKQAKEYEDQYVQVCGIIRDASYERGTKGKPTYLNFTYAYPNHEFTVIIWGKSRRNFDYKPEMLIDHQACVYGLVELYRGKPQMSINIPDQISTRKLPEADETD